MNNVAPYIIQIGLTIIIGYAINGFLKRLDNSQEKITELEKRVAKMEHEKEFLEKWQSHKGS